MSIVFSRLKMYRTQSGLTQEELAEKLSFTTSGFVLPILIVVVCAVVLTALGCFTFSKKMRADLG